MTRIRKLCPKFALSCGVCVCVCFIIECEQPYSVCTVQNTPLHRTASKSNVFPFSPIIMVSVENIGNSCGETIHESWTKFKHAC